MNARPNLARLDELGQSLADQAFRTLISLCPEIRSASPARQETVCAAMRARVAPSIDRLLEDARLAPCLAEAAFHNAVLTLEDDKGRRYFVPADAIGFVNVGHAEKGRVGFGLA